MPMIPIPNRFSKLFLEFDKWNNRWQAFASIENDEASIIRWYKGIGANPDLASKDLISNINNGIVIESQRDINRTNEIQSQAKSRGMRALEKVRQEHRTYEETKPELKDLF